MRVTTNIGSMLLWTALLSMLAPGIGRRVAFADESVPPAGRLTIEQVQALQALADQRIEQNRRNSTGNDVVLDGPQGVAPAAFALQEEVANTAPSDNQQAAARGRMSFESSCTACHDRGRSLDKSKSLSGWRATVRRMASKDGADISSSEIEPIAAYLASRNTGADGADTPPAAESSFTSFATISLAYRDAGRDVLQNAGFFPEVWAGAEWQSGNALSARVNACVTCHSEVSGGGSRLELAEGFVRLDVGEWLVHCPSERVKVTLDAGRVIVPFGAFAAKSHAGAFRTVTRPLIYNMGQLVERTDIGPAILPMPYVDEGVVGSAKFVFGDDWSGNLDVYAINGLQGADSVNFFLSRDYVDNNNEPAVGGRFSLGSKHVRGGVSLMSGRFNATRLGGFDIAGLNYKMYGVDITARLEDRYRFHAEYARRTSEVRDFTQGIVDEDLKGVLLEAEALVLDCPRISVVVRYDEQRRASLVAVPASRILTGEFSVRRFTWGFNWALAGGATLMLNHEHWELPAPLENLDVFGMRFVAAF